jgi:ribonuclease J
MLIPVHGESRHLHEHRRFALEQGIPKSIVQENGDIVRLAPEGPKKVGSERVGRLILDGDVILTADGSTMSQRRKIAANGVISVAVALDGRGGLSGEPQIAVQGIPVEEDRDSFLEEARAAAGDAARKGAQTQDKLREDIRLAVRRCATDWTGKKPVVDVLIVRV